MSLLLDALQRASQEKMKLTEARGGDRATEKLEAAPSTFPELTLEPVAELPAAAASHLEPRSDSLPPFAATPPEAETVPAPDPTLNTEPSAADLTVLAAKSPPPDHGNNPLLAEAEPVRSPVQSVVEAVKPVEPVAHDPLAIGSTMVAPPQTPERQAEPTRASPAEGVNTSGSSTAESSRTEASPRIAREILIAHRPSKRKLTTRSIALLGLVIVVALANLAFFLGFFDSLPGTGDTVVGTGVAVAPPPATAPIAEAPVTGAQPAGMGPADAEASIGAESSLPATAKPGGAGAAVNSTLRHAAQSPTGKSDEKRAATSPSRTPPKVIVRRQTIGNPLQSAYDALRAGRFEEAGVAYRQALKSNPAERDALLGLAHLAHREGSFDEARDLYQQVLRLDPEQPDAAAGLLSIASTSDPAAAASRMRDMAERSPQSPVTMSTLGSMLAREGRIGEAQQAFFRAYTLDPENALHAYNLAVALDRLHKYAQAREFYQRALRLAEKGGNSGVTGFPGEQARVRLEQLRGAASDAVEARPVATPAR